jgi:hypothetical protein
LIGGPFTMRGGAGTGVRVIQMGFVKPNGGTGMNGSTSSIFRSPRTRI